MHRRLLIRPGAIGDCILSLPILEASRPPAPGELEIWAPRPVLPLIRFAGRTRAIADTGLDLVGVIGEARVPALETFDSIYSWYGASRPEFREAVAHLPFTFFPALPIPPAPAPRIPVPLAPVENFAAIHPFSGGSRKNWPLENFQAVAEELGIPVRWCAGAQDAPLESAVRIDDLYELGRWLSTARLYIGNDSGISHLAAAVGVPVVAIFQATDPAVWAPRGAHVTVLDRPRNVEEVARAAREAARRWPRS